MTFKLCEKILLRGIIKNTTPLIIGSGSSEESDVEIILDEEGKPYIPATSFVGVLRHLFYDENQKYSEKFWGYSENKENKEGNNSALICSNLVLTDDNDIRISMRDGVGIDLNTGRACDQKKYNYQILERDHEFYFVMEVSIGESYSNYFKKQIVSIKKYIESGKLSIGAKTTSGFGKIKGSYLKLIHYDFKKNDQAFLNWLKTIDKLSQKNNSKSDKPYWVDELKNNNIDTPSWEHDFTDSIVTPTKFNFKLKAEFEAKSPILINSLFYEKFENSDDKEKVDFAKHIKSNGDFVIPGTSFKGVIRSRAEKIINTLNQPDEYKGNIIKELFGYVDENNKKKKKSKLIVSERYLKTAKEEFQTRIKIDRFTGGAIKGALFNANPISLGPEKINLCIDIFNCKKHEAGLILLVLKDLWTGDCTIGGGKGIGRGVLEGVAAEIEFDGEKSFIKGKDFKTASPKARLEDFVKCLVSKVNKGK